jgi:hypothetical protein
MAEGAQPTQARLITPKRSDSLCTESVETQFKRWSVVVSTCTPKDTASVHDV